MTHKQLFKIFLFSVFLTMVFVGNGFSFIACNGAGGGYDGGTGGGQGLSIQASGNQIIEYYIMEGGGYYLEATSGIQSLLKRVEIQDIQGVCYPDLQRLSGNTLYWMQKAKESYEKLILTAEVTPYNQEVLEKLKAFDYDGLKVKYGLNGEVLAIVRGHLQEGDITGLFKRSYSDYMEMIDILKKIKSEVYLYRMPDLSLFLQLNEKQSETSLLGSYVVRVFQELR